MNIAAPVTDLDVEFSSPGAKALPWRDAEEQLNEADVFWLSTVRPEGRPHVVPLIAVWLDGSLYFATGHEERKAKNLAKNRRVSVTTGRNDLTEGLDIVIEGEARMVSNGAKVGRIADAFAAKYGEGWRLPGIDGVVLFEVTPFKAFGFGRRDGHFGPPSGDGELFSQTRWRFDPKGSAMMLKDKVAVIYGAGGGIGGAVARSFAREGANVFLTGRHLPPVNVVAEEIVSAGGSAEVAGVDALDEQSVDEHLRSVIDEEGRIDISFNAVGIPNADIVGPPLVEMDVEQFSLAITAYATSYFLTARLAARRMLAQRSGVIMTVTALHSRTGIPLVGGYGPAQAAKEALTRDLSAELAPQGIRVVGLRPQGMPETRTIKEAFEPRAEASGMTWEQWQEMLASRTHPRRLMTLEEMANTAAFMASDKASGMTGTTVNLTMGSLDD